MIILQGQAARARKLHLQELLEYTERDSSFEKILCETVQMLIYTLIICQQTGTLKKESDMNHDAWENHSTSSNQTGFRMSQDGTEKAR